MAYGVMTMDFYWIFLVVYCYRSMPRRSKTYTVPMPPSLGLGEKKESHPGVHRVRVHVR